jgi:predicted enzyme related to lactoylglutathione lyase/transcriptional regulator with XRE-family HTH domain
MRAFARHLDLDASTLSQVLRGKRILSPGMLRRLAARLELTEAQVEAFIAAEPDRKKEAARERAAHDALRVLSEPHHLALLELVRLPDFRADVKWVSRVLGLPIDTVNLAVARLIRLGLLRLGGAGWEDLSGGADSLQVAHRVAEQFARVPTPPVEPPPPARTPRKQTMRNPVTRFQILAKDAERSARFYSSVFGWAVRTDNALGYRTLDTGTERGISGGIWPAPPEAHAAVQLFIEVDDLEACITRARSMGGSVVMPPQKLPDGDEMAIITDADGLPVGLVKAPTSGSGAP